MVMGGGGAPKHLQFIKPNGQHIDHSLEPPEIVYSGGDSPAPGSSREDRCYLFFVNCYQ